MDSYIMLWYKLYTQLTDTRRCNVTVEHKIRSKYLWNRLAEQREKVQNMKEDYTDCFYVKELRELKLRALMYHNHVNRRTS